MAPRGETTQPILAQFVVKWPTHSTVAVSRFHRQRLAFEQDELERPPDELLMKADPLVGHFDKTISCL